VRNCYTQPLSLGTDRWASLIAAWALQKRACLVVGSGTATTIDALSDRGEFLGGLILPGIALMQRALAGATAQLQVAGGEYPAFPQNTADAMSRGALLATCGAIGLQYARLAASDAQVLLCGGAAPLLAEHLNLPLQVQDNLVLQGLLIIAREGGGI
jgi:type III pantothenate kinase